MGISAKIIDGKAVAHATRALHRKRVQHLRDRAGISPGLAVVLVGDDQASAIYVSNKIRACEAVGVESCSHRLHASISTEALVLLITQLNADPAVHGILVQLPLPPHIDMRQVLEAI